MKTLNLHRIWEIMNILSTKASLLAEHEKYVYLLGFQSSYHHMCYQNFLDFYSFKVESEPIGYEKLVIFNNDGVAWEDYTNNDFSYLPIKLLSMSDEDINIWAEKEIEIQLEKQKQEEIDRKTNIELQIKTLQKQLENL